MHLFAPEADRNKLYQDAVEMLSHEHGIGEVTLQIEDDAEINWSAYCSTCFTRA